MFENQELSGDFLRAIQEHWFSATVKSILTQTRSSCFGSFAAISVEVRDEYVDATAQEEDEPNYDIGDVLLPGRLLPDDPGSFTEFPLHIRDEKGERLYVPLRWVTHAVTESEGEIVMLPVPEWQ